MGVDILVWRITIGTFTMPNKFRVTARGLKVPRVCILPALRWILILSVVLLNCGDIEANLGLGPGTGYTSGCLTLYHLQALVYTIKIMCPSS